RLPKSADGSAESALRSLWPGLSRSSIRRRISTPVRDRFFWWCASRPRLETDGLRGLPEPSGRWRGGSVEDRPGGEPASSEGRISRGRLKCTGEARSFDSI